MTDRRRIEKRPGDERTVKMRFPERSLFFFRPLPRLAVAIFILSASSCTKTTVTPMGAEAPPESGAPTPPATQETSAQSAAPAPAPAADACPGGASPVLLNGNCSGKWRVAKENLPNSNKPHYFCEWAWKPVSCKSEGKGRNETAQCYGTDTRDAGDHPIPDAQCATK